jgi:lysozyme
LIGASGVERHWKAAIGANIIVVTAVGGLCLNFREYEPDRSRFPLRGIDVSHHQGPIDWSAVVGDDVAFAYIKASEGGDHRDREFRRNIADANRLGLPVGAYHFFTFCRPGTDQARNFIEAVSAAVMQLPPVVDIEFTGNCDHRPSTDELGHEIAIFLEMVEGGLGSKVAYYVPDDLLDAYGEALPSRLLWRRSIFQEPEQSDWTIWQYNPAGRVAGINGGVDLDVISIGLDELMALGKPSGRPAEERE